MEGNPEADPPIRPVDPPPDGERAINWTGGMRRLGAWVLGLPPAEVAGTAAYQRYEELLPLMLAGTLAPTSAEYQWFESYLVECGPCGEEYAELQANPAAAAAQIAHAPASLPIPDLPFLDEDNDPDG